MSVSRLRHLDDPSYNHFYSSTRRTPTSRTYASVAERSSPFGRLATLKPLLPTNYSFVGLAKSLLEHETLKKDCEKRLEFAALKRKFPSLNTNDNDQLLHDKERVVKTPKTEAVGYLESLFP